MVIVRVLKIVVVILKMALIWLLVVIAGIGWFQVGLLLSKIPPQFAPTALPAEMAFLAWAVPSAVIMVYGFLTFILVLAVVGAAFLTVTGWKKLRA